MSYFYAKSPVFLIFTVIAVFSIYCFPTSSAVKIKGGVITSAEILKTQKPEPRNDLIFNLNDFDKTHLEQKLTLEEAIRFENRIGFGAPYDRVKRYIGKTRKEAIDLVINELENYQDNFEWPNWKDNYIPTSFIEQGLERSKRDCRISSFRTDLEFKWTRAILSSKVPQFEKLALLWLDHFSVAFDEYNQTHSFVQHLEFIRKNSIGKFDDFLRQSIMDPAIIVYLNNEQSTTQKPNENLAREFLELFSLGEGNYTENEIKNFAKKLPGYGINHVSQNFQLFNYKISGQTLSAFGKEFQSADEFIDLVLSHPAFGEFISKKFYKEFVDLNDPTTQDLAILVSTFRKYDFNIIKLFEATISLKKFWDQNNRLTLVKSPIELIYGTARTIGLQGWQNQNNLSWLVFLSKDFGQDLFNPPNIAGWPTGKEWLSGQFLEKRMSKLTNHFSTSNLFRKDNLSEEQQNKISEYQVNKVDLVPYKSGKWLMLYLKFHGTSDISKQPQNFTIGLDANLKKDFFHAIRLDKQSFKIPTELSYKNQPGNFFIANHSVKDGTYKKLFSFIPNDNKIKLNSVCKYLTSEQNVSKILSNAKKSTSQQEIQNFLNHDGLIDNVIDLAQKCYNLEDIGLAQVDKSENNKSLTISNKYNEELNVFYKELIKDQLGVETIIINYIPKDFETRKWADINVGFYGVKLNENFWHGLEVKFGTDVNSKMKQKYKNLNRIEVYHGFSNPDIFSSWEGSWISSWNGHYGWNSSFPIGPRPQNFNAKSRDEQMLMIRLLEATEHLLDNEKFSPYLDNNPYVKKWLKDRISETKVNKWSLSDNTKPNTKVFSLLYPKQNSNYKKFDCGPKRAGIKFAFIRSIKKDFKNLLNSAFLVDDSIQLNKLLLPDLNLGLEDEDFQSILSYEGYQLK